MYTQDVVPPATVASGRIDGPRRIPRSPTPGCSGSGPAVHSETQATGPGNPPRAPVSIYSVFATLSLTSTRCQLFAGTQLGPLTSTVQRSIAPIDSQLQALSLSGSRGAGTDHPSGFAGARHVQFETSPGRSSRRSVPELQYTLLSAVPPHAPAATGSSANHTGPSMDTSMYVNKFLWSPSPTHFHSSSPLRHDHAIRSRPEKIVWYASEGPPIEVVPVAASLADVGDIYVHKSEQDVQIWLRVENGTWLPVYERCSHPRLKDHVLRLLDNGDPRWVTKETFRTYLGRRKKQSSVHVP